MNVAETIIRCLESTGVKYVFGIPGEETLDLLDALKSSDIEFIPTRHEQGAAFMAATFGRLTGTPGVVLTTLGPGALNAVTGIAYAYLGQMPLMLISGQKPVGEVKQGNFQMVDVVGAMHSTTLLSQRLMKPDSTPSLTYNMLHTASTFPYGPVHIELAEDIAKKDVSPSLENIEIFQESAEPAAPIADIQRVAVLIKEASAPLIICGQHACEEEVSAALSAFVESSGIPFATTQMGKGSVNEDHELYMGTTALSDEDFVHKIVEKSDCLIMVGHNEAEKPPFSACCNDKTIIHVHKAAPDINETYFPRHALIGNLSETLSTLAEKVGKSEADGFKEYKEAFQEHEKNLSTEALALQIVNGVRDAMPDDGVVTLDNGMYKIWFARHYRARNPNTLLLDNALATMGAGLSSAIAAKLIYPDRKVIAVCGDGGFAMGGQDLETAIRLNLDLIVLIVRDNKFGMIRWKQEMEGYDDYGLDFGNPDFAALARSYGAQGHNVDHVQDLNDTIAKCNEVGGVHVLETPINYDADHIFDELKEIVPQ